MFPIRLSAPIMLDGREVVAAGAKGMGEVVHAKRSGAAGAGGELVLAARYLEVEGRRLKLRSLRAAPQGKNLTGAAGAASIGMGVFAFLIKGGQSVLPWGTKAEAKTAEAFAVMSAPLIAPEPDTGAPTQPPEEPVPVDQPADPQPSNTGEAME